ncbi:flagellar protein FliT [Billgrantia endophytica]|uniref:Flagellar protein FliT n=1 Tax=Billgrantia endophytica TaxID=2033802 RepID=A0A2N7UB73_9GAMM|nr:flagellar protein FliT [Halomonas endophytica]PMR77689.1 flagellar protein [Halomonas endophytica]
MATSNAGKPATVIVGYVQLQELVSGMLELARAGDWEALIERQADYLQLAERLRRLDAEQPLGEADASRKAELLESILADDLAIREYLLVRRNELGQLMDSSRRQRDLHRSYGKQASSTNAAGNHYDQGTP